MSRPAGSGVIRPILFVMIFFSVLVMGIELLISTIDSLLDLTAIWPQWIMLLLLFALWGLMIVYIATDVIYWAGSTLAVIVTGVELVLFLWWLISGFLCLRGDASWCPTAPYDYITLFIQAGFSLLFTAVGGYGIYAAGVLGDIWREQNKRLAERPSR